MQFDLILSLGHSAHMVPMPPAPAAGDLGTEFDEYNFLGQTLFGKVGSTINLHVDVEKGRVILLHGRFNLKTTDDSHGCPSETLNKFYTKKHYKIKTGISGKGGGGPGQTRL